MPGVFPDYPAPVVRNTDTGRERRQSPRSDFSAGEVRTDLAAWCGGCDLAVRRAFDQAVYQMRVEISEAATKLADECKEPPLDEQ